MMTPEDRIEKIKESIKKPIRIDGEQCAYFAAINQVLKYREIKLLADLDQLKAELKAPPGREGE